MSNLTNSLPKAPSTLVGVVGLSLLAFGCTRTYVTNNYYPADDAGSDAQTSDHVTDASTSDAAPLVDAGGEPLDAAVPVTDGAADAAAVDAAVPPAQPDAASDAGPDGGDYLSPDELAVDVFGTYQNVYEFVVSDEQLARMNERYGGGGPIFLMEPNARDINPYGDIYTPGGGAAGGKTFVDHMFVTTPAGDTADFGKVQVNLVGESTGRAWTQNSLPNIKIDTDEFTKDKRLGIYEHVRFNNAVVGSIFREKFTFDFYNLMGYPAPRTTYAWVQSSVWGDEAKVPYVLVESYKRSFCKNRKDYFDGECPNMWEFPGDFGNNRFIDPETCQYESCDSTRVSEFDTAVMQAERGPGFKAALSPWLDWARFHEFQCLSWIFATGDDALHNFNNLVVVERPDGMFQLLPYSVDISFGQDWYRYVSLAGQSSLANGCQEDPECWADTVTTCETLLDKFSAADPIQVLDDLYTQLGEAGMLRSGDDGRYEDMRAYIEERLIELPLELEASRENPYAGYCRAPLILCGDYCEMPEYCYLCNDDGGPDPVPINLADEPLPEPAAEGDGGVDPAPNPCLPKIEYYSVK